MIEFLNDNQGLFWIIAGLVMLIIEGLVLGLGTGVLLFSALGAIVTGLLIWAGVLPSGWLFGIGAFGLCTAVLTALLWKPLKRLQAGPRHHRETSSDFIGLRFRLEQTLSHSQAATHRYSGIQWRVELDSEAGVPQIDAGAEVEVSGLDAGVFRVVPAGVKLDG